MAMPRFNFINAESFGEAVEILKINPKAKVIGGGTDLLHGFKDHIYSEFPDTIVNLRSAGGGYIVENNDGIHIGALTTIHEVEKSEILKGGYAALSEAASTVASPQIRNASTVGGNICQEPRCWYYRNADNLFECLRKGGDDCPAFTGRNDIHSFFGAGKVCESPCECGCPNETPIPRYFELIRQGDIDGAAKLFLKVNPLAAMTGRVCPNTCRDECNRNDHDDAVSIREVERYIGDYILEKAIDLIPPAAPASGKNVAIVGSGPAGLTAAYYLRLAGNDVTVYDKNENAGGMLFYGIPAYRLPKDLVRKNVQMIADMGVIFKQEIRIGDDIALEQLQKDYDAVLLCIGAWTSARIDCEGEEGAGVVGGIDFLYRITTGEDTGVSGKVVAVVGGGNTAMDALRSAMRLGANKVYNFYRRSRAEMPADALEIEEAIEEGADFRFLVAPVKINSEKGILKSVVLQKMELGEPDASGRRRPVPLEGALEEVDVDLLISAVGQGVDPSGLETAGLTERKWVAADDTTYMTDRDGLFAAGDGAQGPETAVKAIFHARKAAEQICSYLGIAVIEDEEEKAGRILTFDKGCEKLSAGMRTENKPVSERTLYDEDIPTAVFDAVRQEAGRCFDCGCVAACPSDLAPALVAFGAKIKTTERTIKAEDFFATGVRASNMLGKGELVEEIILPKENSSDNSIYMKYRHRKAIDFPLFSVAVAITLEGSKVMKASIVLGAAAPVPLKVRSAEEILVTKDLTEALAKEAAEKALIDALPLNENSYKATAAKAYIRRAIIACIK